MPDIPELIVPFDGSTAAEHVLRYACRVARVDYAHLIVICVVVLPADVPLDSASPGLLTLGMRAVVKAEDICAEEGVAAVFRLTYAHDFVSAVVDQAQRSSAALICLSVGERECRETARVSPAVESVLASAPCTVLLSNPASELPPSSHTPRNGAWRVVHKFGG